MKYKPSILISNILDPHTKTKEDLIVMYQRLAQEKRYQSIETRLIKDQETREVFNQIAKQSNWKVVLWLTGDMGRANINLSSLDSNIITASIENTFKIIDLAAMQYCHQIGIASGKEEDATRHKEHIAQFITSIKQIIDYIESKGYTMDIIIEPLDEFAHKKNVIGTLASTTLFLEGFKDHPWLERGKLSLCFDSAHVALNQDDFKVTLQTLAPVISRIHFADAIVAQQSSEYGDNHRPFDDKGIMNLNTAKAILETLALYKQGSDEVFVACEVRTKKKKDAWVNEASYYTFLCDALENK